MRFQLTEAVPSRVHVVHARTVRYALSVSSLLSLLCASSEVRAQPHCSGTTGCSVSVVLQLPRPTVVSLAISSPTTGIPSPDAGSFSAGFTQVAGPTVTAKVNAPYRVTVQAAQSTWSYSGSADNPGKPAAELLWSGSTAGPWISSSASGTLWPVSGQVAPATSGQPIPLFYRAIWTWTGTPPGSYTLPVNITLTSP